MISCNKIIYEMYFARIDRKLFNVHYVYYTPVRIENFIVAPTLGNSALFFFFTLHGKQYDLSTRTRAKIRIHCLRVVVRRANNALLL